MVTVVSQCFPTMHVSLVNEPPARKRKLHYLLLLHGSSRKSIEIQTFFFKAVNKELTVHFSVIL